MSGAVKKLKPEAQSPKTKSLTQWNRRILVVEDEKGIAETYKEILSPEATNVVPMRRSSRGKQAATEAKVETKQSAAIFQFELTVCSSAKEALIEVKKALKEGRPYAMGFFDVLLGDGMDGFELVKEIHQQDQDLYAVFVTAYNDRSIDSINKFLGENMVDRWDYLNKPFTQGEILQKARNFVSLWNLHKEKETREGQLAEINQKLFESERMASVATVARGVGHEFGNLLMQIVGNADVARNKGEEEMRKAFDKILDASQRANDILDRFKNLSEVGGESQKKEVQRVDEIIKEALELMDHQFRTNNIKVCKIKNDKVMAEVNSTAVLQTIVNLSINAMHAMSQSGGQIDYSVIDRGDEFEVIVRDYGPGIDKKVIEKVCEAFFTTKGQDGTGLGLAICKEIVEIEHQGKFSIRNHEMMGFEVTMRMPKKLEKEGVA